MKLKFIADAMLGKLTRWLRMLGQDTIYSAKLKDEDLLRMAKEDKRTLLTRDINLYREAIKNKIQGFYIKSQNKSKILGELRKKFGIPLIIDMKISRCPLCNGELQNIPKKEAAKRIKPNTLLYYSEFWSCPTCLSVYWQGSHWKDIKSTLDEAKKFL